MKTTLQQQAELIRNIQSARNTAAGALLLRAWLSEVGYEEPRDCKHSIIYRKTGVCVTCRLDPKVVSKLAHDTLHEAMMADPKFKDSEIREVLSGSVYDNPALERLRAKLASKSPKIMAQEIRSTDGAYVGWTDRAILEEFIEERKVLVAGGSFMAQRELIEAQEALREMDRNEMAAAQDARMTAAGSDSDPAYKLAQCSACREVFPSQNDLDDHKCVVAADEALEALRKKLRS